MNDPIEQRHKETNARIMAGAKAGKYWLLRSEALEEARNWGARYGRRVGAAIGAIAGVSPAVALYQLGTKGFGAKPTPIEKGLFTTAGGLGGVGGAFAGRDVGERLGTALERRLRKRKLREELINKIIEDTLSGNIGGYNMPMGVSDSDPAMGGRNRFNRQQLAFALNDLRKKRSYSR